MGDKSDASWIRILDNVVGLIVIVVAIVAILELAFSFIYALEVLLVGLLSMGIAWIVMGVYILRAYLFARLFMLITGIAAIVIALVDFIFISLPPDYLVLYPTMAMVLVGSSRLVLGFFVVELTLWIRMLQVMAGILTVNLAAFVFIFPGITFQGVIILLVISFMANGLVRLIVGRTEMKRKIMQTSEDASISE
ncbi:MAG: hypothetical protein ThorAB25_21180 [Candidatus Thorarchaeota archaeon AB_25]|nr:MAG: hypothetical protein ThorAB25_21180 [Candidatus Thorarchaeota archaeon AB_25]